MGRSTASSESVAAVVDHGGERGEPEGVGEGGRVRARGMARGPYPQQGEQGGTAPGQVRSASHGSTASSRFVRSLQGKKKRKRKTKPPCLSFSEIAKRVQGILGI